jgi:predicted amidophosphoribosyltransferase
VSQLFGLCGCGSASVIEDHAETAVCLYCGDEMITACPHCQAPLETPARHCRRCGEEVLEGAFRRMTNFFEA